MDEIFTLKWEREIWCREETKSEKVEKEEQFCRKDMLVNSKSLREEAEEIARL